jgi:5'-nucleotidase
MTSDKPLILLTNDDGVAAAGLQALAEVLPAIGTVYVVAPDGERNATSHSLTLRGPIYVEPRGERRFAVQGTPTDCVNLALHRLLPRRPDLVVSGINHGGNLCEDVTYSGTVAAALEARLLGVPSLAVSLVSRDEFFFPPAARVACRLARWVLAKGLPPGVFLNVNVPGLVDGTEGRIRWTRLGRKRYGDFLQVDRDGQGREFYRYGADALRFIDGPGSADADWKSVEQGWVSVTPLRLDMTDEAFLAFLHAGKYGENEFGQPGVCSPPEEHG